MSLQNSFVTVRCHHNPIVCHVPKACAMGFVFLTLDIRVWARSLTISDLLAHLYQNRSTLLNLQLATNQPTHSMQINAHLSEISAWGCLVNHFHRDTTIKNERKKPNEYNALNLQWWKRKLFQMNIHWIYSTKTNLCV